MIYIGAFIALQVIVLVAYWLMKKNNPQGVLMVAGILMLALSMLLGMHSLSLTETTGTPVFDLFRIIKETFSSNMLRVGLMIMTIGGYVAYMKKIKASDALVYVSMQPLAIFKKFPYIAASIVIPIGQMLFICTPSATGLGLLLVASIFPILVGLGVSRLTAVSVISACTIFDMGPGSANTARAAELVGQNNMLYFVEHQLPLAIPLTILLMIVYYLTNRYFDRKDRQSGRTQPEMMDTKDFKVDIPLIYAILPVLPLFLLIIFSKYASIVYWATGFPVQYTYFSINFFLLLLALKLLGMKFCIKTIFGVFTLTFFLSVIQKLTAGFGLLHDQPFMACVIGASFCGGGIGVAFSANGSTGGTDIIAAIINKYRDITLGRVVLICDMIIISSSYFVLKDWEKVVYGFVTLYICSFVLDQVVNSARQSVQFFIISNKYEEIGRHINEYPHRGVTIINATGFYTGREVKMLFVLAKKRESPIIFRLIKDIDPNAFVSQSAVIGVYGEGFDHIKVK